MRFIRAFLPMEVHRRIAGVIRLIVIAALRLSFGWKLFKLAQPSTIVPSTVKCSSDNNSGPAPIEHRREELFRDFSRNKRSDSC
jgi:hypothetical protein